MIPEGASFEDELREGIALYDVSHLLPRGKGIYGGRSSAKICRAFVHKSGADGPPGFEGCLAMARYCTAAEGRGWPGSPYTYWAPRVPDRDAAGRLVLYRCQKDWVKSFHTGGAANQFGIALAVQGNYDSQWDLLSNGLPRIELEPSPEQIELIDPWFDWIIERHHLPLPDGLSGHWEASRWGGKDKPVCPGDFMRAWVLDRRGERVTPPEMAMDWRAIPASGEVDPRSFPITDCQSSLRMLGYDAGPIDGIRGYRTRLALERFQAAERLSADGWYGPQTAAAMLLALRRNGLADRGTWRDQADRIARAG